MRKIIQIAACAAGHYEPGAGGAYQSELFALCDDGTLWILDYRWKRCQDIPQYLDDENGGTVPCCD